MRKSPDAFRTISEVAEDLDLPQHVLRFWETRFSQIKPMKRGGGRRYYRPDDINLLRGIRHLLYDEGYTIKGVQKILKEQGIQQVIAAADPDAEGRDAEGQPSARESAEAHEAHLAAPDAYPAAQPATEERGPAHPVQNPDPAQPVIQADGSNRPVHAAERHPEPHPARSAPQVDPVHQSAHAVQTSNLGRQVAVPQTRHPHEQGPVAQTEDRQRSEGTSEQSNMIDLRTHPKRSEQGPQPHQPHIIPTTKVFTSPAMAGPTPAGPRVRHAQYPQQGPVEAIGTVPLTEEEQRRRDFGDADPLPADLRGGDPEFLHGGDASVTIEAARSRALEEEQRSGFFSRIIGSRSEAGEPTVSEQQKLSRDEVRRLQSTLFELLECKRILDQARSD